MTVNLVQDTKTLIGGASSHDLFLEADRLLQAGKSPDDPQCRAARVLRRTLIEAFGMCLIPVSRGNDNVTIVFTREDLNIHCRGNKKAKRVFADSWATLQDLRSGAAERFECQRIDEGLWDGAMEVAHDLLSSPRRSARHVAGQMLKRRLLEIEGEESLDLADDVKIVITHHGLYVQVGKSEDPGKHKGRGIPWIDVDAIREAVLNAPGGTLIPEPIAQAITARQRIDAVKMLRATYKTSLLDAVHAVDKAPDLLAAGKDLTLEALGIVPQPPSEAAAHSVPSETATTSRP